MGAIMHFDDTYYLCDTSTGTKHKKRFIDVYTKDQQYTKIGLLNAVNDWNKESLAFHNGRYIYIVK